MEIAFSAVDSRDENRHILHIKSDEGETIKVGQMISIMLTDETYVERKIESMQCWFCPEGAKRGKWKDVESISNGESGEVIVYDIPGSVWNSSMPTPEEMRRMAAIVNIMPYKEIEAGDESIYDHVDKNFTVPDKVIAYLQTTKPFYMCPGIYQHPFKKDVTLLGPYSYTDNEYCWDRDAWKYVVKYHVTLPQAFIDKVMSDAGTAFLEEFAKSDESWGKAFEEWKKKPNVVCLLPDNAGEISLDNF